MGNENIFSINYIHDFVCSFDKKNLLELSVMNNEELKNYYKLLRQYEYYINSFKDIKLNIELREKIHPILLYFLKFKRLYLYRQKFNIISDKSTKSKKSKIYVCNHISKYDKKIILEAIKDKVYLFTTDFEIIYRTLESILLHLNGVIYIDSNSKVDRQIAIKSALELLKCGGNLLVFPEGTCNITDAQIIMELFPDLINFALESEFEVVPIAIERYENRFILNIGENIDFCSMNNNISEKTLYLKDIMATLRYDIWASKGIYNKNDISLDYKEKYIKQTSKFKDENIVSSDEVFVNINKINKRKKKVD